MIRISALLVPILAAETNGEIDLQNTGVTCEVLRLSVPDAVEENDVYRIAVYMCDV